MERIVETVRFKDHRDLAYELLEWSSAVPVGVQQHDGRDVRAFQVVETTLTDGSKVVDIRFIPWVAPAEVKS